MLKLPKIIGHRGVAAYAPENTIEGIYAAADMDIEWVELDVKLTKDQIPILFHDDDLDRTTNGHGPIAQASLDQIRELEAGSWFSDSFAGIQIPTLEEALDVILELRLGLNLEIKPCPGREKETAEVVLDMLSQYWDEHDKILISSFSHVSLETSLDMASDWHRGLLLPEEWPDNWRQLIEFFKPATININGHTSSPQDVQALLSFNLPILAYTINEAELARQLQNCGVYGFFSDAPDVIKDNVLRTH